jgi:hypothetical protein
MSGIKNLDVVALTRSTLRQRDRSVEAVVHTLMRSQRPSLLKRALGARNSEEQAARLIVRCEALPRMTHL